MHNCPNSNFQYCMCPEMLEKNNKLIVIGGRLFHTARSSAYDCRSFGRTQHSTFENVNWNETLRVVVTRTLQIELVVF